ncbi:MAG: phenylalanine--tRNA ligase subunit beta [Bacilli bacterium]|nr:phenylalanine--tRNA ligase subunit beta [Bacilli bacterium]
MINLEWVSDYIAIKEEDLNELAKKITSAGINIEKVITNHIEHLIIGEIVRCVAHPDSDHMHICEVNIGNETVQIVCGAPNVREGLKVIVALPGAILPGDFQIKQSKIRGVESNGMICALFELGLEEKTEENYNKGIHECSDSEVVGSDALKSLGYDTTLYELDIHKHRNNDCYYHIGFAYEIACILNKTVTLPNLDYVTSDDSIKNYFSLKIDTEKCPYYLAKMVTNIQIGPSPDFIKKRLKSVGMRSINNVVDISNYVMLEFGQPLHFFDKEKLGNNVVVRNAHNDEKMVTLDGVERTLKSSDVVITDGEKTVCLAGVMGGLNTDVDDSTKNILIESAIFDAVSIRNTASHLNLKSEASIRYGKGLNYEYTNMAMDRACHLLEKYAGATILQDVVCYDVVDKTPKVVQFKASDVNQLLGIVIDTQMMEVELKKLDFDYTLEGETFTVTIPRRRLDIDPNVNDIAEEIGRLYGYQNLVSTLPSLETKRGDYIGDVKIRKEISKRLRSLGLNECKTYTLTSPLMAELFHYDDKENLVLPNAMSVDKSVIRTSLLPSLLNVYDYNKKRNVKDIFLYEIAKTYDKNYQEETKVALLIKGNYLVNEWQRTSVKGDFYVLKGIIENLLDYLGFKNRYQFKKELVESLHPGVAAGIYLDRERIGILGKVHPSVVKEEIYVCEMSLKSLYEAQIKPIKYKEACKYPEIIKDVAFIVDQAIESESIKKVIKSNGKRILDSVEVFDLYPGIEVGKKSIGYKLIFKDSTRTLLEEEVMEVFNLIIKQVEKEFNAILRDK